jgi:rfaE bifunctional protein nucleotidyltransferase chain/domain
VLNGLGELAAAAGEHRAAGRTIVLTNGCYDLLHAGHVHSLQAAADFGDVLIVAVNSDASVSRLKGEDRPLNCLADRLAVLAALRCVDHVIAFDDDWPERVIEAARPDVYVKGADYDPGALRENPLVESLGGCLRIVPVLPGHSSSSLIERLAWRR